LLALYFCGYDAFGGFVLTVEKSEDLRKALLDCGYSERAAAEVVDCYRQFWNCAT
jgi:hypothetical protein